MFGVIWYSEGYTCQALFRARVNRWTSPQCQVQLAVTGNHVNTCANTFTLQSPHWLCIGPYGRFDRMRGISWKTCLIQYYWIVIHYTRMVRFWILLRYLLCSHADISSQGTSETDFFFMYAYNSVWAVTVYWTNVGPTSHVCWRGGGHTMCEGDAWIAISMRQYHESSYPTWSLCQCCDQRNKGNIAVKKTFQIYIFSVCRRWQCANKIYRLPRGFYHPNMNGSVQWYKP